MKNKPKYQQIKEELLMCIAQNINNPGYMLPSENQISNKFRVSRITAKAALNELVKENLIYRIKGKGTFIMKQPYTSIEKPSQQLPFKAIGLIIPDTANKFTSDILLGADSFLRDNNSFLITINTWHSQETEKQAIQYFVSIGIEGLIVFPVDNQLYNSELLYLTLKKFPLVLIDRTLEGINISTVKSNHVKDTCRAVDYLIKLGHKKIGLISTSSFGTATIKERIQGYEEAHKINNLPVNHKFILMQLLNYNDNWEEKLTAYFRETPEITAFIGLNNDLTHKAVKVLKKLNKQIPKDISVIFYDNDLPFISDYKHLVPMHIKQNSYEIGRRAAELIMQMIKYNKYNAETIILDSELVTGTTVSEPKEEINEI